MSVSALVDSGGALLIQLLREHVDNTSGVDFFIAWGTGDAAWDGSTPPQPTGDETALTAHLGHLRVTSAQYVVSDPAGSLSTADGQTWSPTDPATTPSQHLYLEAAFDYQDEPNATLREYAVYVNAQPDTGHEAQTYLPVADLASLGTMMNVTRQEPTQRASHLQGSLALVLTIEEPAA